MNIYCFSTLSFAKLQFKSVINKAFHKHGVASFTDAWIETHHGLPVCLFRKSHLLQMRGLKHPTHRAVRHPNSRIFYRCVDWNLAAWALRSCQAVASFTDAWIETKKREPQTSRSSSHLLQMRGLKQENSLTFIRLGFVASFTDAWIET